MNHQGLKMSCHQDEALIYQWVYWDRKTFSSFKNWKYWKRNSHSDNHLRIQIQHLQRLDTPLRRNFCFFDSSFSVAVYQNSYRSHLNRSYAYSSVKRSSPKKKSFFSYFSFYRYSHCCCTFPPLQFHSLNTFEFMSIIPYWL